MKIFILCLTSLCAQQILAQTNNPISAYAGLHNTITFKDQTRGNNPWGTGAFAIAYWNTGLIFRPQIEVSGDWFLADDKVGRPTPFDGVYPRMERIVNVMGGVEIQFNKLISAGLVIGPSYIKMPDWWAEKQKIWAVKPVIDITPGGGKWLVRLGYLRTGARLRSTNYRHYEAFTIGVGYRLLGNKKQ